MKLKLYGVTTLQLKYFEQILNCIELNLCHWDKFYFSYITLSRVLFLLFITA